MKVTNSVALYLKWAAIIAAVLACFGISIMAIGYKPVSIGRVMTVVVLLVATVACIVLYRKPRSPEKGSSQDS
ncbi:MAG: preprotein translocase subunit SecE [Eggerthellaceae bacterium]|jgi:hypothetical protein